MRNLWSDLELEFLNFSTKSESSLYCSLSSDMFWILICTANSYKLASFSNFKCKWSLFWEIYCYLVIGLYKPSCSWKKWFFVFHPSLDSSLKLPIGNFQPRVPYKGVPYKKHILLPNSKLRFLDFICHLRVGVL